MQFKIRFPWSASALVACCLLLSNPVLSADDTRPEQWSKLVKQAELGNFYQVDNELYRSEQPDKNDFRALEKMGIKEVLNLRQYHTDKDEAKGRSVKLHQIPMDAGELTEMDMIDALRLIKQRKGPMLVHCWHGADRTGAVIASYRVVFQDWSKQQAIDELVNGDHNFHSTFYSNIPRLIKSLDVAEMRQQLNVESVVGQAVNPMIAPVDDIKKIVLKN